MMGMDGELLQKTCRWDTRDLYQLKDNCEEAGAKALMTEIFGDSIGIGPDGRPTPQKVERHKCTKVWVN